MRSIKEYSVIVDGFRFVPGALYVLEFPNRVDFRRFIFEFDSVGRDGERVRIMHRNKWTRDGKVRVCNGVECLVTLPDSEELEFSKCKEIVDWDYL